MSHCGNGNGYHILVHNPDTDMLNLIENMLAFSENVKQRYMLLFYAFL